jgi:hypothetical protein
MILAVNPKITLYLIAMFSLSIAVNMAITPFDIVSFKLNKMWFWGSFLLIGLTCLLSIRTGITLLIQQKVIIKGLFNIVALATVFILYYIGCFFIKSLSDVEYAFAAIYMGVVAYDLFHTIAIFKKHGVF